MDNKIKTVSVIKRLVKLVKHLWMYYIGAIGGAVLGFITTLLIPATLIDLAWQGLDGHRPSLLTLLDFGDFKRAFSLSRTLFWSLCRI